MLRGPPAGGGRFRLPHQKATPGGPLENHQPAVEEPVPGGKAVLGVFGQGKEEGARADVPQLRLQASAFQGQAKAKEVTQESPS